MKKCILTTILLLTIISVVISQDTIALNSEIKEAVVYKSGAVVTRIADHINIASSGYMTFDSLPFLLDIESIQVQASDGIKIISVKPETVTSYSNVDKSKQTALKNEIKILRDSSEWITVMTYRVNKEILLIEKNDNFDTDNGVNIENLTKASKLYREELRALDLEKLKYNRALKTVQDRIGMLNKRLIRLLPIKYQSIQLIIEYEREVNEPAELSLSYFIGGATWKSYYDLRLDDKKPNIIEHKSTVSQHTGEDWNDVKITLSNRNPNSKNISPRLVPNKLTDNNQRTIKYKEPDYSNTKYNHGKLSGKVTDVNGKALIGANILWKDTNIGMVTDIHGRFSIQHLNKGTLMVSYTGFATKSINIDGVSFVGIVLEEGQLLDEVVVVGSRTAGTTYYAEGIRIAPKKRTKISITKEKSLNYSTYVIARKMNIPSDHKPYELLIESDECDVTFQYEAFPQQSTSAHLKAGLLNWRSLELNEGQMNTYLNGKYISQSTINLQQGKDTLWMPIGEDSDIVLSRKSVEEYSKQSFFKNKTIDLKTFDIQVVNNKKESIKLDIYDQIPISNTDDIEVKVLNISGATYQEDKGFLKWQHSLQSGEQKKLRVSYEIKYGKNVDVINLD